MEEIAYIKLSDLSKRIEQVFKQAFSTEFYWIIAEVSGHKFYPDTDRHYFDLVEKSGNSEVEVAKFKAKSWSEGSLSIAQFQNQTGQLFQSGIQVLIKVKVEYHSLYGLSLTLIEIDPSFTLGNIEKQRRETLLRLVRENDDCIFLVDDEYITKNKKLELPKVIQRIALIASPNSEGYSDFAHTMQNNQHQYKFEIDNYFSSVQGKDAEKELINTLISIYTSGVKYDCVVMIRGGGAKTDFLVFDTYNLSRAVARFPIPIITGIGHHKDVSIVDMMANYPTKTPTKCAELIISHNRKYEEQVLFFQNNILIKSQQLLGKSISEINEIKGSIIGNVQFLLNENQEQLRLSAMTLTNKPNLVVQRKLQTIEFVQQNLQSHSQRLVSTRSSELKHFVKVMKLMSPANILKKGFAIISMNDEVLVNTDSVEPGTTLKINMYQSEIDTKVIDIKKTDGKKYDI